MAAKGIKRVYFNVWADGNIYAESQTAIDNGAIYVDDRLGWAIQSARTYGLEIYAWLEYGTQANYGSLNSFGQNAAAKVF